MTQNNRDEFSLQDRQNEGVKKWLLLLLPLTLFFLFQFWPILFQGGQFSHRDSGFFYYVLFEQIQNEWNAGRLPLWDPYDNLGFPLMENPSSSVFYPLKFLFFGTILFPGSFGLFYKLYILIHYPIAYWGVYRLGRHWNMSLTAAILTAIVYVFTTPFFFQYCNVIFLIGGAWLPYALLQGDNLLRKGGRKPFLLLAIFLALMVLGGDPQTAYLTGLLLIGLAFIYRRARLLAGQQKEISDPVISDLAESEEKIPAGEKILIAKKLNFRKPDERNLNEVKSGEETDGHGQTTTCDQAVTSDQTTPCDQTTTCDQVVACDQTTTCDQTVTSDQTTTLKSDHFISEDVVKRGEETGGQASGKIRELPEKRFLADRPLTRALGLLAMAGFFALLLSGATVLPSIKLAKNTERTMNLAPQSIWEIPGFLWGAKKDPADRPVYVPNANLNPHLSTALLCRDYSDGTTQFTRYSFSLPPWQLPGLCWPNVTGNNLQFYQWTSDWPNEKSWLPSFYLGVIPFLFLLCAMKFYGLRKKEKSQADQIKKAILVWGSWLFGLSLLAALGGYGPVWIGRALMKFFGSQQNLLFNNGDPVGGLYWFLTVLLPAFSIFRFPAKLTILTAIAAALLAGFGWDQSRKSRKFSIIAISFVAVSLLLFVLTQLLMTSGGTETGSDQNHQGIALALLHPCLILAIFACLIKRQNQKELPAQESSAQEFAEVSESSESFESSKPSEVSELFESSDRTKASKASKESKISESAGESGESQRAKSLKISAPVRRKSFFDSEFVSGFTENSEKSQLEKRVASQNHQTKNHQSENCQMSEPHRAGAFGFSLLILLLVTLDLLAANWGLVPWRPEKEFHQITALETELKKDALQKSGTPSDILSSSSTGTSSDAASDSSVTIPPRIFYYESWVPQAFEKLPGWKRSRLIADWEYQTLFPKYSHQKGIGCFQAHAVTMQSNGVYQIHKCLDAYYRPEAPQFYKEKTAAILAALDIRYVLLKSSEPTVNGLEILAGQPSGSQRPEPDHWPLDAVLWKNKTPSQRVRICRDLKETGSIPWVDKFHLDFSPLETGRLPGEVAKIVKYENNRLELEVLLHKPGSVLLAEQFWPGWHAVVQPIDQVKSDSSEIQSNSQSFSPEILREKSVFRRLDLPAGHFRVTMEYHSLALRNGIIISVAAWLICLFLLLSGRKIFSNFSKREQK